MAKLKLQIPAEVTHVVKRGENLYTISNRYGVSAKDVRKWNKLKSSKLAKGKRLILFIDNGGVRLADKPADTGSKPNEPG